MDKNEASREVGRVKDHKTEKKSQPMTCPASNLSPSWKREARLGYTETGLTSEIDAYSNGEFPWGNLMGEQMEIN